ncbi:MAG: hypothetical protein FK730_09580 [Asgard group archaeon]|nr:hypothetical protein [Asgard group archaeon]
MPEELNEFQNNSFQFKTKHLAIIIPIMIVISIGIFAASIYLFLDFGKTSGIVFGFAILFLLVLPIVIAIIFYFKKIKGTSQEIPEKKKITLQRVE